MLLPRHTIKTEERHVRPADRVEFARLTDRDVGIIRQHMAETTRLRVVLDQPPDFETHLSMNEIGHGQFHDAAADEFVSTRLGKADKFLGSYELR